ncbi:unnamed protein product [Cladocopium goreaui]|uniref:Ribosomal RNA large subunit methyltransferase J n=1 Tax=Cladocopium goreaui TaxID=2562237 RepID=A0A9P1DXA3_9DINO|nr:unnamed protein product [Cladocopium goreaui]
MAWRPTAFWRLRRLEAFAGWRHGSNWRSLLGSKPRQKQRDLQQRLRDAKGDQVLQLFQREGSFFDTIHLLTALRAVVLSPPSSGSLGPLLKRAAAIAPELTGNDLAALAWSLARLEVKLEDQAAFATAAHALSAATTGCGTLKSAELSVVAWAMAKLPQEPSEDAIQHVLQEVKARVDQLTGKETVNLVWAFSKMQVRDVNLIQQMAKRAVKDFSTLNRQDTGNAAWAFAKADVSCETLMSRIREKFLSESDAFDAQEFASIIWAFAWLDAADEVLLRRFRGTALKVAGQLNCGGLARVSWAFASMAEAQGPLFGQLKSSARRLGLGSFGSTELSKITWAFAKAEEIEAGEPLMLDIARQVEERMATLNARDVDMMAWAFAKVNADTELMARLAKQAVHLAPHLDAQGLANCAAAFALLRVAVSGWRPVLVRRSAEEILHFSAQALCDLRWALTVQGWVEPTLENAIATAPGWAERSDYVHETQAGAVADCFKHLVLVALLQNLQDACLGNANHGDDSSIFYVDTHAGAGLYEVKEPHRENLRRLLSGSHGLEMPASLHAYIDCLNRFEGYPGSPVVALDFLARHRSTLSEQRAVLFEAARSNVQRLCDHVKGFSGVEVLHEDAYRGLPKLFTVSPRSPHLVFIDPPYDLCFADNLNFTLVQQIQQHWPESCVAIWLFWLGTPCVMTIDPGDSTEGCPGLDRCLCVNSRSVPARAPKLQ